MQSTRHTLGEYVVPHAPGAIGPVAREEAAIAIDRRRAERQCARKARHDVSAL
jgi:hypothetical protein